MRMICLGILIALAGCALKPELIQATRVPQEQYMGMSCEALRLELEMTTNQLDILSARQRSNRVRDGWTNLVLPGVGIFTPDQEVGIGLTRGRIQAIRREHLTCKP